MKTTISLLTRGILVLAVFSIIQFDTFSQFNTIGATEVNGILRVKAGSGYLQLGQYNTTDNYGYISSGGQSNGTGLKFETTNGGGTSSGATRMTILNNGNVGVGTLSPSTKLEVTGILRTSGYGAYFQVGPLSATDNFGYFSSGGQATGTGLKFETTNGTGTTGGATRMTILSNGYVGIGTTNPQSLLAVAGSITAKEINVTLNGWADYVFENTYNLRPLSQVESFIKENKHLPEIPSAKEVEANGINLGEMDALLLKKIEELTLYMIQQEKRINIVEAENKELKNKLNTLKN